jgi:hypothetical protein
MELLLISGLTEVLSGNLPAGTSENHDKPQWD